MKTGSFFTYQGPGRISISRSPPRTALAGFRVFKALAPGPWFNSVTPTQNRKLYNAQLSALDPAKVWQQLHALASDAEPVLLCYEMPPFTATNFCHRRLVAEWFAEHLGHVVHEHIPAGMPGMAQAAQDDQGALFPTS